MNEKKSTPQFDWEKIEAECKLLGFPEVAYSYLSKKGEAFVSGSILLTLVSSHCDSLIGYGPKIIRFEAEFPVTRGRIDFLLFHEDGSLTVCEVKDGRRGLQSVLAGIGQVMSYAIQVGMAKSGATSIRRALMFSATGNEQDDVLICEACEQANVITIPSGDETKLREAAILSLSKYVASFPENKCHQGGGDAS